jgi:hypothetical protein
VWAADWQWRTPLQVADFWNKSAVVRALGATHAPAPPPPAASAERDLHLSASHKEKSFL